MTDKFLGKVFGVSGNEEMRALYDDWASEYDRDVLGGGYVTPQRVASALRHHLLDQDAPILDFGCGTGLSGEALAAEGFRNIDGTDLSAGMLELARARPVYRQVWQTRPDEALPVETGAYKAVTAIGVISVGAAPGSVYDDILDVLAPGGLLAFSMNDESMKLPEYAGRLKQSVADGEVTIRSEEYGPHLSNNGENSGATVYVLERL